MAPLTRQNAKLVGQAVVEGSTATLGGLAYFFDMVIYLGKPFGVIIGTFMIHNKTGLDIPVILLGILMFYVIYRLSMRTKTQS